MLHSNQETPEVITTTGALSEACEKLARSSYVAVDTEFIRESTFWPNLCLIQLAAPGVAVIVDPLARGIALDPFFALMANDQVVKVFHAARQDVEIVFHLKGIVPAPLFDTQVAAMVCGFGELVSYSALVKQMLGRTHDKTSRYTDWARRPLSEPQLHYAIGDVTHLSEIYPKLLARLEAAKRAHWLADEMAMLAAPETYETQPEDAWRRLKLRVRTPKSLAVAVEVAAWREHKARDLNKPRAHILKDEAIADVAAQAPRSVEELGRLRSFRDGFAKSPLAREILEAVQKGLALDPAKLPAMPQTTSLTPGAAAVADLLRVLLKAVAGKHDVASKLIATADDLEKIAMDDNANVPALSGWRRELFGEAALALKAGRLALTMKKGEVIVAPVAAP